MAHAPSSPEDLYLPSDAPSTPPTAPRSHQRGLTTPPGRILVSPRPPDSTPFSPNCRRLQLRNAGFRAALLQPRRLSSPLSNGTSSPAGIGPPRPFENDENEPRTVERRPASRDQPRPRSILQEIHDSARKTRRSPRSPLSNLFPDITGRDSPSLLAVATFRSTPSPPQSPTRAGAQMPQLREISGNAGAALPPSSPPGRAIKGSAKRRSRTQPTPRNQPQHERLKAAASAEASRYIDHLETQLASTKAQLEAVTSPSTIKAQSARIRSLQRHTANLSAEVADWTARFEERVEEAVWRRARGERDLRARVRELEEALDARQTVATELEFELDEARARIRQAEEMEVSLGRRVDVLTELLAQSPTRLDPGGAAKRRGSRCSLPPIPLSPSLKRLSRAFSNDGSCHSSYQGSSRSIQECPEDDQEPIEEAEWPPGANAGLVRHISWSADSGSPVAKFTPPAPHPPSRRTSTISMASNGAAAADTPSTDDPRSCSRRRTMRRFAPGTTTLKPLILPTAAALPPFPASAPAGGGPVSPFHDPQLLAASASVQYARQPSSASVDPTTAFLSPATDEVHPPSPSPIRGRRPTSGPPSGESKTQDVFESRPFWEDTPGGLNLGMIHGPEEGTEGRGSITFKIPAPIAENHSLHEELERVEGEGPWQGECVVKESFNGEKRTSRTPQLTSAMEQPECAALLPSSASPRRTSIDSSQMTPKPFPCRPSYRADSLAWSPASNASWSSSASVVERVRELLHALRDEPIFNARRILLNSLATGLTRLGRLPWWLFGLALRSSPLRCRPGTLFRAPEDDDPDSESQARSLQHKPKDSECMTHHGTAYTKDERTPLLTPFAKTDTASSEVSSVAGSRKTKLSRRDRLEGRPALNRHDRCEDRIPATSKRQSSLRLWAKFSLALVMAIGVAVVEGPAALLEDEDGSTVQEEAPGFSESAIEPEQQDSPSVLRKAARERTPNATAGSSNSASTLIGNEPRALPRNARGHRGWDYPFVENLGPEDFARTDTYMD